MPNDWAESSEGLVLTANGIDPVERWDGFHSTIERAGVIPPGVALLISPDGSGPLNGRYVVYYSWVDRTGIESSLSPVSNEANVQNAAKISIGNNIGVPFDVNDVVKLRFYRNLDGDRRRVYLELETTDLAATSVMASGLTLTDAQLRVRTGRPIIDELNLDFTRNDDPPPDHKPFIESHGTRMYLAGVQPYSEGSVSVVSGGTSIIGTGTEWPWNFANRLIYVDGATKPFTVHAINADTQTITLEEPYAGPTNKFAAYTIKVAAVEDNLVYVCESGKPESWPARNAFGLPQDGDTVTNEVTIGSYLYIFKRTRSYRFTVQANPLKDGFLFAAADRGCINHRCCVQVGDIAYILDERGVYRFDGSQAESVSDQIQDLFRPDSETPIYWPAARFFHGIHAPIEDSVLFFVNLRGDYLPRQCLAYNYRLGRWDTESYPWAIGASAIGFAGRPTATYRPHNELVYLGSTAGRVFVRGESPLDALPDGSGGTTILAAVGPASATVAEGLPAGTVPGFPIALATGAGRGQIRVVVAINGSLLTLDQPWLVTPAVGDRAVLGGIAYTYRTHHYDWAQSEISAERMVQFEFGPVPGESADLKVMSDTDLDWQIAKATVASAANAGVAKTKGRPEQQVDLVGRPPIVRMRMDGHREGLSPGPESVKIEITGVSGRTPHKITGLTYKGATT